MGRSAIDVSVTLEGKCPVPISPKKVEAQAKAILKLLGCTDAELDIRLVSDKRILAINRKYLNHPWATDVISFGYLSHEKWKKGMPFFGDLVISYHTTLRQAQEFKNSFFYELIFYVCHGILHIAGDDDHSPKMRARMLKKQAALLKKIGMDRQA